MGALNVDELLTVAVTTTSTVIFIALSPPSPRPSFVVCPQQGTQARVTLRMGGDEEEPSAVTLAT